jgi:8-oxo-dGTP pyrophosphatase MutT (NUDIX family)
MRKEIKSTHTTETGHVLDLIYSDIDDFSELKDTKIRGVRAFCFCGGRLVIVLDKKNRWMPPGGGVEVGESPEQATIREVREETNMRVLKHIPMGIIKFSDKKGLATETRSFCLVEPYGPFLSDPDGDIIEIKLIDPADYNKYFNWGEGGDYLIQKALELLKMEY